MKITLTILALFIVLCGLYIYMNDEPRLGEPLDRTETPTEATFTDQTVGLTFDYKTAPDGYVVDDVTVVAQGDAAAVVKAYRIMNAREKAELEQSAEGRDGPPVISVMVFANDNNLTASQWVDANPRFSNIDLAIGTVDRDATLSGANAVRYRSDGLYLTDNVVVAHGNYVYLFAGSFLEEDSTIRTDFAALLDSVRFTPETETNNAPQSKIDPRVACESALAYMTFPDGEAAEAFVTECINGEHTEVIDRYINDMGLDGAAV